MNRQKTHQFCQVSFQLILYGCHRNPQLISLSACQDDDPAVCDNGNKLSPGVCNLTDFQKKCKKTCNKCPQTPTTGTGNISVTPQCISTVVALKKKIFLCLLLSYFWWK